MELRIKITSGNKEHLARALGMNDDRFQELIVWVNEQVWADRRVTGKNWILLPDQRTDEQKSIFGG